MSKPIPHIIARRARDIIADKKNWCIHATSRTKYGREISYTNAQADKFCAIGAIYRAAFEIAGEDQHLNLARIVDAEVEKSAGKWLPDINDEEGHKAILKVFDAYLEKVNA